VADSSEGTDEPTTSRLEAMLNASPALARFAFFAGVWAVVIDIINITIGAYAAGQKVVWAGFLSMGKLADNTYVAHAGNGFSAGDAAFSIIAFGLLAYGIMAINHQEKDGFVGWLKGLTNPTCWKPLVTTKAGTAATLGSWSLLVGILFYIGWSINYNTWVDPGVYAVTAPLVGFGLAFKKLNETESRDE
jgi:hypothetical protein